MTAPHQHISVDTLQDGPSPLRIALVTETYPPEINGVAMTLQRLVSSLMQRGHRVQLIRPRQPLEAAEGDGADGLKQVLMRGWPVPKYPHLRMGLPAQGELIRLWTLQRPDVVHIATEGPLGWSALKAAKKLKLPVSADFRTQFHAYTEHYKLSWLRKPILAYLRQFHNRCDFTMVPTEGMRAELAGWGFERLLVVGRGVDIQYFSSTKRSRMTRADWGVSDDDCVILSVGRLASEKNLRLLIRAREALVRTHPQAKWVIVGDGPEKANFMAQMPGAVFTGPLSGEHLARVYASADVFAFPSLTETFGNVTLEAMASGLSVVAFDYAAAALAIDHEASGHLVPVGDENAFLHTLGRAVSLAHSQSGLRTAAQNQAAEWSWSWIAQRVERHWSELLSQKVELRELVR
jgi:glycosyltransferase involved in cell wall biosynthesis